MVYELDSDIGSALARSGHVKFALHVRKALLQLSFLGPVDRRLADLAKVPAGPVALQPDQFEALTPDLFSSSSVSSC